MDEIFLIYTQPEDHWEHGVLLGFTETEEEAIAVCARKKQIYDIYKEVSKYVRENVGKDIVEGETKSSIDVPKWKAGIAQKDITVEMRAERDAIHAQNEEINNYNSKIYREFREAREKAKSDYIDTLEYDEDTMKYLRKYILDSTYGVYLQGYTYEKSKNLNPTVAI